VSARSRRDRCCHSRHRSPRRSRAAPSPGPRAPPAGPRTRALSSGARNHRTCTTGRGACGGAERAR
jgi:hypothetical protein